MYINLPVNVKYLLNIFHKNGYEAYVVGGCVRDSLLGKSPKDWDITTNALSKDIKRILNFHNIKVVETGIKFGTVTAILNNCGYEITTYRSDSIGSDGRKPNSVCFVNSLEEDIMRRDLTINGLAYNDEEGIIDLVNGIYDLSTKQITFIGNIQDRLKEDVLRSLRAFRFCFTLNFSMDSVVYDECYNCFVDNYKKLSMERIKEELIKLFSCDSLNIDSLYTITLLLSQTVIPEIKYTINCTQHNSHHKYDVYNHIIHVMDGCKKVGDPILMFASLLHDIGKPLVKTIKEDGTEHFIGHAEESVKIANRVLRRLKFTNDERMKIVQLVEIHDMFNQSVRLPSVRKFMSNLSLEQLERYKILRKSDIDAQIYHEEKEDRYKLLMQYIQQVQDEGSMFKLSDLNINGNDIISLGIQDKTYIKDILNDLLLNCYGNPALNNREWLLKYAKKRVRQYNAQCIGKV